MTSFRPDQIESIAATLTSTSRASIAISRTCVSVRSVATDDACFGQETQIIPVGLIRPRRSRSCPLSSSWLRTNTWTKSRSPDSGLTIRTPSGKGPRILRYPGGAPRNATVSPDRMPSFVTSGFPEEVAPLTVSAGPSFLPSSHPVAELERNPLYPPGDQESDWGEDGDKGVENRLRREAESDKQEGGNRPKRQDGSGNVHTTGSTQTDVLWDARLKVGRGQSHRTRKEEHDRGQQEDDVHGLCDKQGCRDLPLLPRHDADGQD